MTKAPCPGLALNGISHSFSAHRVLHNVSINVAPGELVCLLGPSGCGKTTLLRIAAGLEELQTGLVSIDGIDIAEGGKPGHLPPERRGVGLMFQDFALFPHLSVRENITFGLDRANSKNAATMSRLDDTLKHMGLAAYADAYPHTLSGGQQQRVALIRALAPDPKILLLDEPFSGLDVSRRAQIRADTLDVVKQSGVAALMVTHDPEEAMFMADRILVMNEGRVVQDGTPVDLYFQPKDAFVAEFFGPVNRFAGTVANGTVTTPVGAFDATAFTDGTAVNVMIHPEGFRLSHEESFPQPIPGDPDHLTAALELLEVVTARPLGRSSFAVLRLADGNTIEARIPGIFLPDAGTRVRVGVNARQAHIFKAG